MKTRKYVQCDVSTVEVNFISLYFAGSNPPTLFHTCVIYCILCLITVLLFEPQCPEGIPNEVLPHLI